MLGVGESSMSFELQQLRGAAEKYTFHDAGTHGVWPRLVWEFGRRPPAARLDDSVEFLGKWKALALQRWEDGVQKDLQHLAEKVIRGHG